MARVRRGFKARRRRNKVLKMAKGFHFDRRTKYRHAVQTVERAPIMHLLTEENLKRHEKALDCSY